MPASSNGKVKISVLESKLEEAFRHLDALNNEHGQMRDSVQNLEVKTARIDEKLVRIESKLEDNTSRTNVVWATVVIGFVAAFLMKVLV